MKLLLRFIIILLLIFSCNSRGHNCTSIDNPDTTLSAQCTLDSLSDALVQIDSTTYSGLKVYYPSTSSIGLFVGEEPDTLIETICFVCAASYTKSTKHHGLHSDIAGAHIVSGVRYDGYDEDNNTGGFVYYAYPDNKWEILDKDAYLSRLNSEALPITAFTQELLILDGIKLKTSSALAAIHPKLSYLSL